MRPVAHKKQFGMYTILIDIDGGLQIQAPTLLKPLTIEAQQAQEFVAWLANAYQIAPATTNPPADVSPSPVTAPTTNTSQTPEATEPAVVNESPQETTRRIIQETIFTFQDQNPGYLAPENRDRLIEHITRNATIRPLMSQGKVTYKQILLWTEQAMGTNL